MNPGIESEAARSQDIESKEREEERDRDAEEAVKLLEEGSESFRTPSDFRLADEERYEDIVDDLSALLTSDFEVEKSFTDRALSFLTGKKTPLVYDPSGRTQAAVHSYSSRNSQDTGIEQRQSNVVAGYLLAESINLAGEQALERKGIEILEARADVDGETVAPGEEREILDKTFYDNPDAFFTHAAIRHVARERNRSLRSRIEDRAYSPGSDGAEEKKLKEMIESFENYSGRMQFRDFVGTYQDSYLDEDHPVHQVVNDELANTDPVAPGLLEGIYEMTESNTGR